MPKTSDAFETLARSVAELRAVSRYVLEVIELQVHEREVQRNAALGRLVTQMDELLRAHVERIDQLLPHFPESQANVRLATAQMSAAFVSFFSKTRSHVAAKMLRDDSALLSFAASGYMVLHTTAVALKHGKVAEVSMMHYQELTTLLNEIHRQLPSLVMADLSEQFGGMNLAAAESTLRMASEVMPLPQDSLAETA